MLLLAFLRFIRSASRHVDGRSRSIAVRSAMPYVADAYRMYRSASTRMPRRSEEVHDAGGHEEEEEEEEEVGGGSAAGGSSTI